jgi:hypothetical protein
MAIGVAYSGTRFIDDIKRDMRYLADIGFTGVLHTFSENDFAYFRPTMKEAVEYSRGLGLEVLVDPWGVGNTFGGQAESWFIARHPDECQTLSNGRPIGAACLNSKVYREFLVEWAAAAWALEPDALFWDEPHWASIARLEAMGRTDIINDKSREEQWACTCSRCVKLFEERYEIEHPRDLTDEVVDFRRSSLVSFISEVTTGASNLGAVNQLCLLPHFEGPHSLSKEHWEEVASLPSLSTFGTDPYWGQFSRPLKGFVDTVSEFVVELAKRHGKIPQIWIQGFKLGPEDAGAIETAVAMARAAGVEDLWVWGYRASGYVPWLGTRDPETVWSAIVKAMTGRNANIDA